MKSKYHKNNHGFTLVELIATITLLTVVIAVSTTLMIQLFKTDNHTSDQLALSQEANILINELKQQYESGTDFDLSYEDGTLHFSNSSSDDALAIEKLSVTNGETNKLTHNERGTIRVNTDLPFSINLTVSSNDSKSFKLKTTWENQKDHSYTIAMKSKGNTCNGFEGGTEFADSHFPSTVFTNGTEFDVTADTSDKFKDKFKTFYKNVTSGNDNYISAKNGQCEFEGNTLFPKGSKHWDDCKKIIVNKGSARFEEKVQSKKKGNETELIVAHDLFLDDGIEIEYANKVSIKVGKNFIANGDVEFEDKVKKGKKNDFFEMVVKGHFIAEDEVEIEDYEDVYVRIDGNVIVDEFEFEDNGKVIVYIGGYLRAYDEFEIEENESFEMEVRGSFRAKESEIEKNGPVDITIGGSADFGKGEFKENIGPVTINVGTSIKFKELKAEGLGKKKKQIEFVINVGHPNNYSNCVVFIDEKFKMEKNKNLIINGNTLFKKEVQLEDESKLTIERDALFEDKVKLEDESKLIIEGDAKFQKEIETKKNSCITVNGNIVTKNKKDGQKINQCSD